MMNSGGQQEKDLLSLQHVQSLLLYFHMLRTLLSTTSSYHLT
ncbi:hypothetical protein DsansV1_C46g0241891 [Dioscorea sansibarensis]